MTFRLRGEEAKDNFVLSVLFGLVGLKTEDIFNEFEEAPEISVEFKSNHAEGDVTFVNKERTKRQDPPQGSGITFSYVTRSFKKSYPKAHFGFTLNPRANKGFVLYIERDIHRVVNGLFGTEKRKTLESLGLEVPESLKVNLEYRSCLGGWHALPPVLRQHISGFDLSTQGLRVKWPRIYDSQTNLNGLDIFKEGIPEMSDREMLEILKSCISRGIIHDDGDPNKKGRSYSVSNPERERFSVKPKQMVYENILFIEEKLRKRREEGEAYGHRAIISIEGDVGRNDFFDLHTPFYSRVDGYIEVPGIKVVAEQYDSPRKGTILVLDKTNLEQLVKVCHILGMDSKDKAGLYQRKKDTFDSTAFCYTSPEESTDDEDDDEENE